MVSAVLDESPLTLQEAAKLLPGRPHINTLRRWADQGRLRTFRMGRKICTTRVALNEFLAAGEVKPSPQSSAHLMAEAKLDSLGIS